MKRIVIIGATGSGKTTLAGQLARLLDSPHIELDALHWNPNWQASTPEDFIEKVDAATKKHAWVTDGNYTTKIAHLVWTRADTVVWLDYSFRLTFFRLLSRTLRRTFTREECCNGNRESLGNLLSKDSILLWLFQSYWRHRREYSQKLSEPNYQHLRKVRLRSPKETARWLEQLSRDDIAPSGKQEIELQIKNGKPNFL